MRETHNARTIAPHEAALKSLGITLFCGGPDNRRDANRFLSLGREEREWAGQRAKWLHDQDQPYGNMTVAECWKIAIDEALDPGFNG